MSDRTWKPPPYTEAERAEDDASAAAITANVRRLMDRMRSPDEQFAARRAALRREADELAEWIANGRPC